MSAGKALLRLFDIFSLSISLSRSLIRSITSKPESRQGERSLRKHVHAIYSDFSRQ